MQFFTKPEVRESMKDIQVVVKSQLPKDFSPLKGALWMMITFVKSKPKSKTVKDIWPTQKPDLDNYGKHILDSLNELVFVDDSQIVQLSLFKIYGKRPRVEITVEEILASSDLSITLANKPQESKQDRPSEGGAGAPAMTPMNGGK